jgi:hypothetical protein
LRDAETYRTVVEKPPLSINQKEQKAKNMNESVAAPVAAVQQAGQY